MAKTILLTGATDGIGFETSKKLVREGHNVLLLGRNENKLEQTKNELAKLGSNSQLDTFCADLSEPKDVAKLALDIIGKYSSLDVLINNAGVFKIPNPVSHNGYDKRFLVNTIAPYILTNKLLPLFNSNSRVVNLSSAAQSRVNFEALAGDHHLTDNEAYAQSKLAITMWSFHMAKRVGDAGPIIVAINPASFLGSKMVKEAYGTAGKDLSIGAEVLTRAALHSDFADSSGKYFDNDIGSWASPHPDALDDARNKALIDAIDTIVSKFEISLV